MEDNYNIGDALDCENERDHAITWNESSKRHINKLRSFKNIDLDVIIWVETKILSVTRRIHKYDDALLVAYIIKGYRILKKPYDMDQILECTETTKLRKKILDLIGWSTKNTPINEVEICMPIIVVYPVDYVGIIIEKLFNDNSIKLRNNSEKLRKRIEFFTRAICDSSKTLSNYEPRSSACAFVFFYITNFVELINKDNEITVIKKTHFKRLSFGKEGNVDVNPKDFDICRMKIERYYKGFLKICTKNQRRLLIFHDV